jgi:hypothetical protein
MGRDGDKASGDCHGYMSVSRWRATMKFMPFFAAAILLGSTTAVARAERYLDLSLGGGRADQTLEARADPALDLEFKALTVWRFALGGGVKHRSGFEVGPELAGSQRGGVIELYAGSPLDLVLTRFEAERWYLDASISVRRSWRLHAASISVGVSPRVSRLLVEVQGGLDQGEPQDWVFGVDPEVRVAYSTGFAWVRYYWDLTPSYDVTGGKVWARSLFFGVGLRIF